ncbi:MAG: hypothetical protein ACOX9R_17165, partial [Armatimonadota bacterium]
MGERQVFVGLVAIVVATACMSLSVADEGAGVDANAPNSVSEVAHEEDLGAPKLRYIADSATGIVYLW